VAAPADVEKVCAALVSASEIGPYFAVEFSASHGEWRTVADLWTETGCLSERVNTAREFLRSRTDVEIELRSCASISSLGFMSRLVSPALATACLAGVVPRFDPQHVHWLPVVGGPVPIALATVDGTAVGTAAEAAVELERAVLLPCVEPVLTAYSRQFRLSLRVLRGNVASALAGAACMLTRARVSLGLDPVEVVHAMLARPSLTGSGHYERPFDDRAERFFVRHNCCLFYRVPGGGTCGDCVLVPDVARLDMWRAALTPAKDTTGPTG
jgi:ferric iron reductase protein FhuF